ncbi:helix-turn-helix transcriptional regulator [Aquicoccus porphyridii]|uniref:Helix-turn-helix transcriptional regulator n=1 Tax=Aquicoccus porphyridii TaxID=1852029 RepID=A0A5A9YY89_9RHOB|nr:helix-turn-helix transcriptional regulator [Aquicoccus porphyridii]KAA0909832.1 helix-turn-helix transcriptional regulator [Aquicoccus porphyridii]RAI51791.1 hypothetical protein DOO74_21275 [Rhodobacteraceae bacterium AsT-22]
MNLYILTGPELKSLRRNFGINQTRMAELIGTTRQTISYWERKVLPFTRYDMRYGRPNEMLQALGVDLQDFQTSPRARGDGVLQGWRDWEQERLDRENDRLHRKAQDIAARYRQPCGATTRKGQPCRLLSEPGKRRCKFHGGKSTGPRTPEGKARISEAQRKRWAAY